MIKFKFLIHKPTDTTISYDRWIELLKGDSDNLTFHKCTPISNLVFDSKIFKSDIEKERFIYQNAKEILFSDDFEIVYESDFANYELEELLSCNTSCLDDRLYKKIEERLSKNKWREFKYDLK